MIGSHRTIVNLLKMLTRRMQIKMEGETLVTIVQRGGMKIKQTVTMMAKGIYVTLMLIMMVRNYDTYVVIL